MPLTVVFVRHGESTANVDRVFANRLDNPAPLTPVGFAQAESLVHVLGPFAITHVYTSPLARARQTAAVIAGAFGVTCTIVDAMREYDVGEFEDESYAGDDAWRWRRYEEVDRAWGEGNHLACLAGGESLADIETRFMPFMESLAAGHLSTDTLALAGHGGLYRAMLPKLFEDVSADYARSHQLGHGDVVIGEYDQSRWRCVQWANERFPHD